MFRSVLFSRISFFLALGISVFFLFIFSFVRLTSPQRSPGCYPVHTREVFDPSQTAAVWQNQNIQPLLGLINQTSPDRQKILGIQSQDKSIDINLTQKTLTARQGSTEVLTTPINIGKYVSTPVGEFSVYRKYLSVDLSGGSNFNHTYFYLPNVPYALYFSRDFAIIGSYWSRDFGQVSGFGCLEVPPSQAEILYYWADSPVSSSSPGTKVTIHN